MSQTPFGEVTCEERQMESGLSETATLDCCASSCKGLHEGATLPWRLLVVAKASPHLLDDARRQHPIEWVDSGVRERAGGASSALEWARRGRREGRTPVTIEGAHISF